MGCDIHDFIEYRNSGEPWQPIGKWTHYPYGPSDDKSEVLEPRYPQDYWYGDRNYNLFSILADVRNGYGFAGVDTGTGFRPISKPRGLPHDVSREIRTYSDWYGSDGHSHSHLTLGEILSYDWTQTTVHTGVIDIKSYNSWRDYGKAEGHAPNEYSASIDGPNIETISMEKADEKIQDLASSHIGKDGHTDWPTVHKILESHSKFPSPNDRTTRYYVQIHWESPYHRSAGSFWSETIPRLLHLQKRYQEVRLVFWFDN